MSASSRPRAATDKDVEAFRRLIRAANETAKNPCQTTAAKLDRAAAKAARAVLPAGQLSRDSALFLLTKLGQRYLESSPETRAEAVPLLTDLARRCSDILTEPVRRHRADVDG